MSPSKESEDAYKALVAELAYSIVPTSIMGITILGLGGFIIVSTGSLLAALACALGAAGTLAKILLTFRQRRFNERGFRSLSGSRGYEIAHFVTTGCVAASVGSLSACAFRIEGPMHLLATALLFGYCAGVVCRLSVRPWLAGGAVAVAATPGIVGLASNGDATSLITAATLAVFALGSLETIIYSCGRARKLIEAQLQMAALARLDPLTGLPNRLAFDEAVQDAGRFAQGPIVAMHAFDLDRFKDVNDHHGHATGDAVLAQLSHRLKELLSSCDFAARIGGDEFIVVQGGISSLAEPEAFARKVHERLTAPYPIGRKQLYVGLSLGYAVGPSTDADLRALRTEADAASYRAKHRGGGSLAA